MALTLQAGRYYYIPWIGADLNLADAPWKGKAKVYDLSANGQGFVSGDGSSTLQPVQKLTAAAASAPVRVYLFSVGAAFTLADADVGSVNSVLAANPPANVVSQRLSFPAGASAFAFAIVIASGEAGTYALDASNPATSLSAISYTKTPSAGGSPATVTLPVTLAVGDTLTVTATTASGVPGTLALITQ